VAGSAHLVWLVKALVAEKTSAHPERLALETRINLDLGCDGDDAVELFEAFAEKFHVDMSSMEWNRYFSPEGCGCLLAFVMLGLTGGMTALEPVTVRDLVKAAEAKKWVKTDA
jgi:hypothetical protein